MKLIDVIQGLCTIAKEQPNIRTIITNDVYKLDAMADVKYNVFCVTQNKHREDLDNNFIYFNLNLFYIDRLTDDYANEVEIQSTAIEVLHNIIASFNADYGSDIYNESVEYTVFEQKFTDLCAGAYATLSFAVPISNGDCYEEF